MKIGKSVDINRRFTGYRKETKRAIYPIARWQPSCDFLVTDFEQAALSLLPEECRERGDWYRIDPQTAIEALETVRGYAA